MHIIKLAFFALGKVLESAQPYSVRTLMMVQAMQS